MKIIPCNIPLLFFFILFHSAPPLESAKILVYIPRLGYSHMRYIGQLADVLVEAGHNVTALVISIDPDLKNVTGTKLAKIINWDKSDVINFPPPVETKSAWEGEGLIGIVTMLLHIPELLDQLCIEQLMDYELIGRLKAEKFDLGLSEMFVVCASAVFEKVGVRNYVFGHATNAQEVLSEEVGVSNNPSFVPTSYSPSMDTMSYTERFSNFMIFMAMKLLAPLLWFPDDKKLHSLSPNYHSTLDAISKTSFLFVNSDELLDFPQLVSHKIIFVGGIAIPPTKPLNKEYQKLMDSATDGAVLMSFGTIAKSSEMSQPLKDAFVGAFKSFPNVKFIWKHDDENDNTVQAPNIIKKNWVPQNDLLYHPNLRAFITHCGLNSLLESATAGVPVICIPLFGDQIRNTKVAEKRGIGISLDKMTLNSQVLTAAIHEILDNEKYQKSARRLAQMIREKPFTPRERFLRNVEFALKFGPIRNFDLASNELNFFQYYLLDIIIPLIVVLLFLTYISIRFACWIIRRLLRRIHKSKTE